MTDKVQPIRLVKLGFWWVVSLIVFAIYVVASAVNPSLLFLAAITLLFVVPLGINFILSFRKWRKQREMEKFAMRRGTPPVIGQAWYR